MNTNVSTFAEISQEAKYEGQWVIIVNKKVAFSGTAKEIKEKIEHIRKEYPNELPLIAKVPKKILQIV